MDPFLRRALITGLLAGAATVHISLVGLVDTFQSRGFVAGVVSLGTLMPLAIAFIAGWRAGSGMRSHQVQPGASRRLAMGAVAGAVTGGILALLTIAILTVDLRAVLVNASNTLVEVLHFGLEPIAGAAVLLAAGALLGVAGAMLHVLPVTTARAVTIAGLSAVFGALMEPFIGAVLRNVGLNFLDDLLFDRGGLTPVGFVITIVLAAGITYAWSARGGEVRERVTALPPDRQRKLKITAYIALVVFLLVLPQVIGQRLSEVINTVGLFVLLGLGLNIVVGFAGLLDLGYVAFYAVGAYTTAVLTSPGSPAFNPELPFWGALPFVIVAAGVIGLIVGAPVLRLRGDYLAIVTLGFGEIARIMFLSSWTQPLTGGAQGILSIPPPLPFDRDPQSIYYPILIFCILAAIAATSLASSRIGRAWNAMREDESVAEATGVNTVTYKLLAFGLGAAFGCLSGAFFAAKIGTIFPNSFDILVSINALALIILGGMGNIAGVVVGALVLVGLPELLREFAEYRLLIYGAVLVAMMLLRPEGLLPNKSRRAELHESTEDDEALYEREAGVETGRPVVTG